MWDYFNYTKSLNDLALVLSVGHFYKFTAKSVEKRIIDSKYFSLFTSDFLNAESYKTSDIIVKEIFPEHNVTDYDHLYNECRWASMMYLFLLEKTKFNFETLFTYIGIDEAFRMFKIYHEIDFTHSYNRFMELYKAKSIIKSKMNAYGFTNEEMSKKTLISLSMIDALKNRRRDAKKLELEKALKLSEALHIHVETLLNN